ncbi:hypothetical protein COU79_04220 [Candidatus Peregrinibacteria bacterium CG10_big_fil_rev_8_21_14_0_10_54_7]|nr:MAG: hypothetical protein COU79_04220 [Candidatus Peregrinibacteria bacterium CG10_big_fil_rev_8_21_14_0_10_54_7]
MNLEYISVFYIPLLFPGLLVALWLCFTAFPKHSREKLIILGVSGGAAVIAGGFALVVNIVSLFQGNFLFFLTGPFLALILGGLAGIACFVLLLFLYYIPVSLLKALHRPQDAALPAEDQQKVRSMRLVLAAVLVILLATGGLYVAAEQKLKSTYGSPSDDEMKPLTEEEMRTAYSHPLFRNHDYLLRGLFFRENLPADIIEDIYRRRAAQDENVLSSILFHPNTPCSLLEEAYRTLTSPQRTPAPYEKYEERCL